MRLDLADRPARRDRLLLLRRPVVLLDRQCGRVHAISRSAPIPARPADHRHRRLRDSGFDAADQGGDRRQSDLRCRDDLSSYPAARQTITAEPSVATHDPPRFCATGSGRRRQPLPSARAHRGHRFDSHGPSDEVLRPVRGVAASPSSWIGYPCHSWWRICRSGAAVSRPTSASD